MKEITHYEFIISQRSTSAMLTAAHSSKNYRIFGRTSVCHIMAL